MCCCCCRFYCHAIAIVGDDNADVTAYLIFPCVQVHNQVLWFGVSVTNFTLVTVFINCHFVGAECEIWVVMAGLGGHSNLELCTERKNENKTQTIERCESKRWIELIFSVCCCSEKWIFNYLCLVGNTACRHRCWWHNRCVDTINWAFATQWNRSWTFWTRRCFAWNTLRIIIAQYCAWKCRKKSGIDKIDFFPSFAGHFRCPDLSS